MHRFGRVVNEVNKERCFKLNNEFRDIRLSINNKVKDLQNFINLVAEYKVQHPKSDLSELKLPHDINAVKNLLSKYTQYDPKLKYAFIRAIHGRFISSQAGGRSMTAGDRPVPLGWEVFAIEERQNGKVAIKSCGKYVSSENGERGLQCDRLNVGATELFDIIEHGNGIYSFKGNNSKYISSAAVEETLSCNSDGITDDEKFHIEWMNDLSDEINISWKYYDQYFNRLCVEYDAAVEDKKKIDPDDYFIVEKIELYNDSSQNTPATQHKQRIFNQKDFKKTMQEFDRTIYNVQLKLNNETSFLTGILWSEKANNERIIKMSKEIGTAYAHLQKYLSESNTKK